jgi:hypothetical protein
VWTFAKTYAATWPHEYVVRTSENAPMILALARHIFEHGTDERFYSQIRKYHHEGGKVFWSMDPTPEATTLINRCDEGEDLRGTARGQHSAEQATGSSTVISLRCGIQRPRRLAIPPIVGIRRTTPNSLTPPPELG